MSLLKKALNIKAFKNITQWVCITSKLNDVIPTTKTKCLIATPKRTFHFHKSLPCKEQPLCKQRLVSDDTGVQLYYGDYHLDLPYIWLRDHCRCQTCYNPETFQKNVENYELSPTLVPENVELNDSVLTIKWPDNHFTSYSLDWLIQNTYHQNHTDRVDKVLWNKAILESYPLPVVKFDEYMNTIDGLKAHLTNLVKFGFSIVSEAPTNHDGTLEATKRICHIMETFYGHSWQFTTNMEFKDTAYTTLALGAHTDNTYLHSPAGIQVFHVVKHDGEGGKTLLVDGFNAAENLRNKHPDSFDFLTKAEVPHEYIDNDRKMRSIGTVLKLHPTTGNLINIRFNPYDRAPLYTLPGNEVRKFYDSYEKLTSEIKNPENEFWIKLAPDMVLFVDNWRALHGRAGFTGSRYVSGCYVSRDDWTAIARVHGLLNL